MKKAKMKREHWKEGKHVVKDLSTEKINRIVKDMGLEEVQVEAEDKEREEEEEERSSNHINSAQDS